MQPFNKYFRKGFHTAPNRTDPPRPAAHDGWDVNETNEYEMKSFETLFLCVSSKFRFRNRTDFRDLNTQINRVRHPHAARATRDAAGSGRRPRGAATRYLAR